MFPSVAAPSEAVGAYPGTRYVVDSAKRLGRPQDAGRRGTGTLEAVMTAETAETTTRPGAEEVPASDEARAAIVRARDQIDASLRALGDDADPSEALTTLNECSDSIAGALWFLRLAQREQEGGSASPSQ